MSEPQVIEFAVEQAGERLDKLVVDRLPQLSRSQIQTMIKTGLVTVDQVAVKPGVKLRGGEVVRVTIPPAQSPQTRAERIDLTILYEDADLSVIDKPAGMVVHPGTGVSEGTLVNALLARYPELSDLQTDTGRQGIVHRLDKDTSGVMVVARNASALVNLQRQFQARTVEKVYLALVERAPKTLTGRIEAPIGRDPKQRKRMAVIKDGKPAITEFRVLDTEFRDGQALVELNLLTGRTHQIRVHMAFIGAPIVGDSVYGFRRQRTGMKRNFLHAVRLSFDHPTSGERLTFSADLPAGLQNLLEKLR